MDNPRTILYFSYCNAYISDKPFAILLKNRVSARTTRRILNRLDKSDTQSYVFCYTTFQAYPAKFFELPEWTSSQKYHCSSWDIISSE